MPALSSPERVALLEEASTRTTDEGVRAQLHARLATELMFTPRWRTARALAEESLAEARRSGRTDVLPEVLMRHFQTMCTPHTLAQRREHIQEALALTRTDPIQRYFVLNAAACAAIQAVQLGEADAYLSSASALGRELEVPLLSYGMAGTDAWRLGLAGELDAAEAATARTAAIGARHGVGNGAIGPALQQCCIRWHQGRFIELLPILRASPSDDAGSAVLLARALACSPETVLEATGILERAAADDFAELPLGLHWAPSLVAAAETAFMLGNARVGATVLRLLAPFADQAAFDAAWVLAPVAYGAALAASAASDPAADDLFEQALAVCERLDAPILRARTEIAWSRALLRRGDDDCGARDKALALLDAARATVSARGVDALVESLDEMAAERSGPADALVLRL